MEVFEAARTRAALPFERLMPAWLPGVAYAVKVINIAPANAARGLAGLHASVLLHDATINVPRALIDGDELTARRTAAAAGLRGEDFDTRAADDRTAPCGRPTSSARPRSRASRWCRDSGWGRARIST